MTWERWLRQHQLLSSAQLGLAAQLAIGYAANVLWLYWAHRARHQVRFLWRWLHQLHHSPRRVEILTAFYKHPLEIVAESVASAALLYLVLGLSPRAVLVISAFSGAAGLFLSLEREHPALAGLPDPAAREPLRAPPAGRPRVQLLRAAAGGHAVRDLRNPASFDACGFGPGREERFAELLRGRDVSATE